MCIEKVYYEKEVNRSLLDVSHITADVCECPYEVAVAVRFIQLIAFCPLNRPCVLMCSEARGEEAAAGTLLCRPSEIVAAPKVRQNTCAYGSTRGKQGCIRDADAV